MNIKGQNSKKSRRKSGAPEARSFVTPLFSAAPKAPKAPGDLLPAEWWPKVIFGLILAITVRMGLWVFLGLVKVPWQPMALEAAE